MLSREDENVLNCTLSKEQAKEGDYFAPRVQRLSLSQTDEADDFLGWTRRKDGKESGNAPAVPSGGGGGGGGGGFIGRFKMLGKIGGRREKGDGARGQERCQDAWRQCRVGCCVGNWGPASASTNALTDASCRPTLPARLRLHPCLTRLIFSKQHPAGWSAVYHGTVASGMADIRALEDVLPFWLLEYLLCRHVPVMPIVKVQDKLDRLAAASSTYPMPSPRSSVNMHSLSHSPHTCKAEEAWEILCNDVVLPLDMTLAAVRQYV
ncbi:hypothetical protein K488DRAFT_90455 [Vararia minispora EC-137]|uniref:Uncharacterized protein n=1 Tax=Vararia minispora EC-137 TaxID=1314806 RepID=A0ACB8Q7L7_9AGAM|nr:hypothetical protein K488DRAFT_90455 [Vararia minispora EC-137]